jgi:Ca-activated chloride channel family protein
MDSVVFRDPLWLALLACIPVVIWLRKIKAVPVLIVPFVALWNRRLAPPPGGKVAEAAVLLGIALIVLALARPQHLERHHEIQRAGYDIMLAIDLSRSMQTEDYELRGKPITRLQALKPVIEAFLRQRPEDRVGIVVFSGQAYTLSPPTFNHAWLLQQFDRINPARLEDGTAIGDGLTLALSRLKQPPAGSTQRHGAFVMLFTDGENNSGIFSPDDAVALAQKRQIPLFTFAIGSFGYAEIPYVDAAGEKQREVYISKVDEVLLWKMANATGGAFFRAESVGAIERAFHLLNREKRMEFPPRFYFSASELFQWFALPGFALYLLAVPFWRWTRGLAAAVFDLPGSSASA